MPWRDQLNRVGSIGRSATGAEITTVEAAGLVHGVASIQPSFWHSLLPRTTAQQAGATGVIASLSYGITATQQSFIEAIADRAGGREGWPNHGTRRAAVFAADLAVVGASIGAQRALRQQPGEPVWRATARSLSYRTGTGAVMGAVAITTDGVLDTLTGTHTAGTVNAAATVLSGAGVGALVHFANSRRLIDTAAETDQYGEPIRSASTVQPTRAVVVGTGVAAGLYGVSRVESAVAGAVAHAVRISIPGLAPLSGALGHLTTLGGFAAAIWGGIYGAKRATEEAGTDPEAAYQDHPQSALVSSGPGSVVDWDTIGREGRRFVSMVMSPQEISEVIDAPAVDPIRVFVGVGSADNPDARADLAMKELERTGAFQRPRIVVYSPTGSGYVNYVAVETMEMLTAGNVAGVCIQYSVRPSFLSLGQVATARDSTAALLNALALRVRTIPEAERPQILVFGESLGSQSAEDVFKRMGVRSFEVLDISAALFLGSPYASIWRRRWLTDPERMDPEGQVVEVQGLAEFLALPEERQARARVVMLTHNNDPIPKFGPILAVQRPDWLGDRADRPPGIPVQMRWWPIFTFLLVGVDLLNADNVVPGKFEAWAHDYRKDVPRMIRAAFRIDVADAVMHRIESKLRQRELDWAERRLIADKFEVAESDIRDTLDKWGVDHTIVPNVVVARRPDTVDPYQAEGVQA